MIKKEFSTEIGGKTLTATFTDLAERAHGSVLIRYGNSIILATAVMSKNAKEGGDFFPLTVEYEEKFYAAGQILGSRFMKREGRPSDEAILSGRIVDRTIRPLFDQWIRNEVQVIITVLSLDEYDTDILGVIGASLALGTSNIPWNGPVSGIRVAKIKGSDELISIPTFTERNGGNIEFELVACGKDGMINMIELGGNEIKENAVIGALEFASKEIEKIQSFQKQIIKEIGVTKRELSKPEISSELASLFEQEITSKFGTSIMTGTPGDTSINELKDFWMKISKEKMAEKFSAGISEMLFEEKVNDFIHEQAIKYGKRVDGRKLDEIRPLFAQAGDVSPIVHGSGIFYRGGTHILSVLTLGGPQDAQIVDGMEEEGTELKKRYMHHYNFPPFSTGEVGRTGGTNRRMIGHGYLAEKAIEPVLPSKEDFPYTIRVVSEAFSSNGSTSMGSTCGSTIALMDGGVPIKSPVAGIASGLMLDDVGNFKVLTDIQGPEDHYGDMDFKVAGTKDGITAMQMDVKVSGVPLKVFTEALEKARVARMQILDVITKAIPEPRKEINPRAPKIVVTKIKQDQIGLVIGSGGKTINEIREATGTEIEIEDDGTVYITGKGDGADNAKKIIEEMTHEYKVGEKFEGLIVKILDFGAFVKIGANTDGLVHVSEIAPWRIEKVSDVLKEGMKVPVVVKEIDKEKGRIGLSIKGANPDFIKKPVK